MGDAGHRYRAVAGVLLALSLEACGWNPPNGSGRTPDPRASTRTLRVGAHDESPLSFYDPEEPPSGPPSAHLAAARALFSTPPARTETKPLPWAIPESVFFVYKGHRSSELRPRRPPVAAAFVLSVPDRAHDRFTRFLVTARHVVDPEWAHCSARNPESIDLRLNRRSGGVGYETIPLQSRTGQQRFVTPADPTADLAVIPLDRTLLPRLDEYKFLDVPFRLLPTESELGLVRKDQPVMTARPSAQLADASGDFPVFDAGSLSTMPAETVAVHCGPTPGAQWTAKMLHVWFISAGIPQGVSGAPVYTSLSRGPGVAKTPVLLGIQSVAWPDRGIAGITPSAALGELIESALRESGSDLDFYRGPNTKPPPGDAASLY